MADTATTLGVKNILTPLLPEQVGFEATHVYQIDYTDVNTGSGSTDTETVKLMDTPAEWMVTHCVVFVATAFAGAGSQVFNLLVGTDGDPNNFITSTDVFTAGPIVSAVGGAPITLTGSFGTASDVIRATFTNVTAGAPDELTAGRLFIYIRLIDFTNYVSIAGANKE